MRIETEFGQVCYDIVLVRVCLHPMVSMLHTFYNRALEYTTFGRHSLKVLGKLVVSQSLKAAHTQSTRSTLRFFAAYY